MGPPCRRRSRTRTLPTGDKNETGQAAKKKGKILASCFAVSTLASRLTTFAFGAILGTSLFSVGDALGIEHAANDVITHARQVAHATAPDQHNRVLLKVVSFA